MRITPLQLGYPQPSTGPTPGPAFGPAPNQPTQSLYYKYKLTGIWSELSELQLTLVLLVKTNPPPPGCTWVSGGWEVTQYLDSGVWCWTIKF